MKGGLAWMECGDMVRKKFPWAPGWGTARWKEDRPCCRLGDVHETCEEPKVGVTMLGTSEP